MTALDASERVLFLGWNLLWICIGLLSLYAVAAALTWLTVIFAVVAVPVAAIAVAVACWFFL